MTQERASSARYEKDAALNTISAKRMADGLYIEYRFGDADGEDMKTFWKQKGIRYAVRSFQGEQYITMVPLSADESEEKLPCVMIMQEVDAFNPHQAVTAFGYFE